MAVRNFSIFDFPINSKFEKLGFLFFESEKPTFAHGFRLEEKISRGIGQDSDMKKMKNLAIFSGMWGIGFEGKNGNNPFAKF
jgi:hypothetical protein